MPDNGWWKRLMRSSDMLPRRSLPEVESSKDHCRQTSNSNELSSKRWIQSIWHTRTEKHTQTAASSSIVDVIGRDIGPAFDSTQLASANHSSGVCAIRRHQQQQSESITNALLFQFNFNFVNQRWKLKAIMQAWHWQKMPHFTDNFVCWPTSEFCACFGYVMLRLVPFRSRNRINSTKHSFRKWP